MKLVQLDYSAEIHHICGRRRKSRPVMGSTSGHTAADGDI